MKPVLLNTKIANILPYIGEGSSIELPDPHINHSYSILSEEPQASQFRNASSLHVVTRPYLRLVK